MNNKDLAEKMTQILVHVDQQAGYLAEARVRSQLLPGVNGELDRSIDINRIIWEETDAILKTAESVFLVERP